MPCYLPYPRPLPLWGGEKIQKKDTAVQSTAVSFFFGEIGERRLLGGGAAGDDLIAAVVGLADLLGQAVDGSDGGLEAVAADGCFDIVQAAGDLVAQLEESGVEGVD